jgi:hypothetical protein
MKEDSLRGPRLIIDDSKRAVVHQPKVDESKRVAFYHPISEGLPLRDCDVDLEKRSLSIDEMDAKGAVDVEKRSAPNNSFESSNASSPGSSTASTNRQSYDYNFDDDASVASTFTYGTVDTYGTTATSESVQSIISRLQSETDRRRRRLERRRYARGAKGARKPRKPADPLKGITVEIRE